MFSFLLFCTLGAQGGGALPGLYLGLFPAVAGNGTVPSLCEACVLPFESSLCPSSVFASKNGTVLVLTVSCLGGRGVPYPVLLRAAEGSILRICSSRFFEDLGRPHATYVLHAHSIMDYLCGPFLYLPLVCFDPC